MPRKNYEIKKVEKLPNSEAQITGEITLPFLVELRQEAIKHLGESVKIDGFRAGHVPEGVLVSKLGEMKILEEAAELALGREYGNIANEAKLKVLGHPHITITKLAPGIPLEFRIRAYLEPEFSLPDYKRIATEVVETDPEKRRIKIVSSLVEATEVTLPTALVEFELERMVGSFKTEIEKAGVKWQVYLDEIKKTEADIKNDWRKQAADNLKAHLILSRIAETEKLDSYQKVFELLETEKA